MEMARHFSHEHPLALVDLKKDEGKEVTCHGCGNSSTGPTYCCQDCQVFLHKSCQQLPTEIIHPMHPHPLKLIHDPPFVCKLCLRHLDGFMYCCPECDFDLDVSCSQSRVIEHPGHPHPLKLHTKTALLECDACKQRKEDQFYDCTVCSFSIHKTCANLQEIIFSEHHLHPLSLAYGVPDKFIHNRLYCHYCYKSLHRSEWSYCCLECGVFIHLKCAASTKVEESSEDEPIPPGTLTLPVAEGSSLPVASFLKEIELQKKIEHFSHDHALILTDVEDDYRKMFKDDQDTVCNACVEHISGPCYTCVDCKYFLHVHCTQLPKEVSHDGHPEHKLSLTFHGECFNLERCQTCQRYSNGFFYECKACNLSLDIKCALFPPQVKHLAHKHLLRLATDSDGKRCNACSHKIQGRFISCHKNEDFNLHIICALLPETVLHRWDAHPLILRFPPFYGQPDEFVCKICEEEINPNIWLYYCEKCDNSFHTECLPRIAELYKVKLGCTLKTGYHQHPLTFSRRAKYKSNCQDCHKDLSKSLVFECQRCAQSFCHLCVGKFADTESSSANV